MTDRESLRAAVEALPVTFAAEPFRAAVLALLSEPDTDGLGVSTAMCRCGHLDVNHSDIDLDVLGDCYQCDCTKYRPAKTKHPYAD